MRRREFTLAVLGAAGGASVGLAAGSMSRRTDRPSDGGTKTNPHLIDVAAFHEMRRFVETPFGRIAYIERGAGPVALFLHGLPLNGFQWRGALERLWPQRQCVAPDLMGLGYSEVPDGQALSPPEQSRMVAALLDALGADAVDLVANDSGNTVAQLFATQYPERVRTMLLTNGDVHENSPPPALQRLIAASRAGTFVDDVLLPQLADPARALQPTGLGGLCYTDPAFVTPTLLEVYLRPLVSPGRRAAQFHRYCAAFEPNPLLAIEQDLTRSPIPLRVVWGTGDHFFPGSAAEWLDRTLPHSRGIRWVEGARLFFPEEMPDLIAEEARALWASGS